MLNSRCFAAYGLFAVLATALPGLGQQTPEIKCAKKLRIADVSELVEAGVGEPRIRQFLMTCGIDFAATPKNLETLRAAGSSLSLMELISSEALQRRVEYEFWMSVKDLPGPEGVRGYLRRYENGDFTLQAKLNLKQRQVAALRGEVEILMVRKNWTEAFAKAHELITLAPEETEALEWKEIIVAKIAALEVARKFEKEMHDVGLEFVPVPAGSFVMGSAGGTGTPANEHPQHSVRISKPFEMSKFEVTQRQWRWLLGTNPSRFVHTNRPVEEVTWFQVQEFIERLNQRNDGYRYRLPTEAEWEYAARGGGSDDYAGSFDRVAWYLNNSAGSTHEVGQKEPNAFGLYDMHGNVWEWCDDWYSANYYEKSPILDPQGPQTGKSRVLRGGSWRFGAHLQRAAVRFKLAPSIRGANYGFRLARQRTE